MSEQPDLFATANPDNELEFELQRQWERNRKAQAHQWTDEAFCIRWACGCDDRDWWNSLPQYERNAWLNRYRHERARLDMGMTMRSAEYLLAVEKESYEESRRLAESWAEDIREAFKNRQPCPIQPEENYRHILDWAFRLAGVPAECLQPAESNL